jgi:hypothetical protein
MSFAASFQKMTVENIFSRTSVNLSRAYTSNECTCNAVSRMTGIVTVFMGSLTLIVFICVNDNGASLKHLKGNVFKNIDFVIHKT